MEKLRSMTTVRVLAVCGFLYGIQSSLWATFTHIGSEAMGPGHTWYHFLREVGLDIGALSALLIILFGAAKVRTPATWWIALVLMLGYYAPYWVGAPFMEELYPPGGFWSVADWNHYIQAGLPLLALFLGRGHFYQSEPNRTPAQPSPARA
jgi:hypothetical protein